MKSENKFNSLVMLKIAAILLKISKLQRCIFIVLQLIVISHLINYINIIQYT